MKQLNISKIIWLTFIIFINGGILFNQKLRADCLSSKDASMTGLKLQYIYAIPNQDMDEFVNNGQGGRIQLTKLFGETHPFTRLGLSSAVELSFLRYDPVNKNSRYDVYSVGFLANFDLSILSVGLGCEATYLDVKLNEILYSHIYYTAGLFAEGGVNIPLFIRNIILTANTRYTITLPMRDRVAGSGNREIYFTMNNLKFYGGVEFRI